MTLLNLKLQDKMRPKEQKVFFKVNISIPRYTSLCFGNVIGNITPSRAYDWQQEVIKLFQCSALSSQIHLVKISGCY